MWLIDWLAIHWVFFQQEFWVTVLKVAAKVSDNVDVTIYVHQHFSAPNFVWRDTWERGLDVGFCGQLWTRYRPYYPITRIWSTSPFMVLAQLFPERLGTLSGQQQISTSVARSTQWTVLSTCILRRSSKWLTISAWCWKWCSLLAENVTTSAFAKWKVTDHTKTGTQCMWLCRPLVAW